jgi:hypothetical protein
LLVAAFGGWASPTTSKRVQSCQRSILYDKLMFNLKIKAMNKFEQMPINEFDKFVNKRIKIDYFENVNDKTSLRTLVGIIKECSVGEKKTYIGNAIEKDFIPVICNFINEENKEHISIKIRNIENINIIEK